MLPLAYVTFGFCKKLKIFEKFVKKAKKKRKIEKTTKTIDEFGGFGPGNKLLRRFGGNPSKNRPNRCLGGDFLGQTFFLMLSNKFEKSKKNKKQLTNLGGLAPETNS